MTWIYRNLSNLFSCVHTPVLDEGAPPSTPGTPDAMDRRAPESPQAPMSLSGTSPRGATPPSPKSGADVASGLRYGVEVEHQGTSRKQVGQAVRAHVQGATLDKHEDRIRCPDGRVWHIDRDAGGLELVTPILQGPHNLELLQRIVVGLAQAGGEADERAGLHVHIDGARFSPNHVQALVILMVRNEHWLYPLWGVHQSRRSQWCQEIDPTRLSQALQMKSESVRNRLDWLVRGSRYYGLNLQNHFTEGAKHTVEFRYLNGSLDPCAIGCAVGFYMALAEQALQTPAPATTAEEAATPIARSSLPELLRDMELPRSHPVAAHLYGQLQARVEEGWDTRLHGPRPNVATLLGDDAFVINLCADLDVRDTPVLLASAVKSLVRAKRPDAASLAEAMELFSARISRCVGMHPSAPAAERLVDTYGLRAQELTPYLKRLGLAGDGDPNGNGITQTHLDETLTLLARSLPLGTHLRQACDLVTMLASTLNQANHIGALRDFLSMPKHELADLHGVLAAMPKRIAAMLGQQLIQLQASGEDIRDVGAQLLMNRAVLEVHSQRTLMMAMMQLR